MNQGSDERPTTTATHGAGATAQTGRTAKRQRRAAPPPAAGSGGPPARKFVSELVDFVRVKTVVTGGALTTKLQKAGGAVRPGHWQSRRRGRAPNDELMGCGERHEWEYVRTTGIPEGHILPQEDEKDKIPAGRRAQFYRDVADLLLGRKLSVDRPLFRNQKLPAGAKLTVENYSEGATGRYIKLEERKVPEGDPAYPHKGLFNNSGAPIAMYKPIGVYAGLLAEQQSFDSLQWESHPAGHMKGHYAWDIPDPAKHVPGGCPHPGCGPLVIDAFMYRNELAFANDHRMPKGEVDREVNTAAMSVRAPLRPAACAPRCFSRTAICPPVCPILTSSFVAPPRVPVAAFGWDAHGCFLGTQRNSQRRSVLAGLWTQILGK